MPRGGRRAGRTGVAYQNRSDLNGPKPLPPQAATGQPYGVAGAQLAAQRVVPVASGPLAAAQDGGPATPAVLAQQPYQMPQLPPLDAASARPNEPVTAGMALGPGPGPEALGVNAPNVNSAQDAVAQQLRGIYLAYPTEELRALLEVIDNGEA